MIFYTIISGWFSSFKIRRGNRAAVETWLTVVLYGLLYKSLSFGEITIFTSTTNSSERYTDSFSMAAIKWIFWEFLKKSQNTLALFLL